MSKLNRSLVAVILALGSVSTAQAEVPWPEGWRDWHHVKSMVIQPGHPLHAAFGGIHHLYANDKALEGYRSGTFPDGAVIAFDLLEAEDGGNALVEGERKVLGVMHKDAARWSDTGGWGFEGFGGGDPDTRVVGENAYDACFACHQPQAESDFVFSRLRD
ncbi:MAG: cytochrome P460 family protein [Wenzhouxiangellaceae bacterium]|nr:cytochrome P460 family protein [Wenzhouxiangellaceae bacterium]